MSENALVQSELDLPVSNIPMAQLAKLSEKGYLPFVKLVGTSSKEAETGSTKPGTYVLQKDENSKIDLTGSFEALVIAARPLACRKTMTTTERYYDMASAEYQQVEKDSQTPGFMGVWHGTEYLIWVRSQRAWATYHASSETARSRSSELTSVLDNWAKARLAKKLAIQKAGTDEAEVAKANAIIVPNPQVTFKCALTYYQRVKKNQWAPLFAPCTTPFSEVPPFEEVRTQSMKFVNPPKVEKETVETGSGASSDRG